MIADDSCPYCFEGRIEPLDPIAAGTPFGPAARFQCDSCFANLDLAFFDP